jgi:transcriptional regulator with XRE-family HTH domain
MPTKAELGRRLRVARFERNMTLKEVAARCGMSATHISEVERGKTSPTIGALQRIAAALGEKTSYFVQEDELPRVKLTRAGDRCEFFSTDAAGVPMRLEMLSSGIPGGYAQIFKHRLDPGSTLHGNPRIGEAVVHCITGMERVSALGQSHVLREGDTMQLRIDDGFTAENIGDDEAVMIVVMSAPTLLPI